MKQISLTLLITLLSGLTLSQVNALSLSQVNAQSDLVKEKPIDPFDYNFCGGERVYPIVGVNITTACGPRNQVALGRRGKLMWFFPGQKKQGNIKGAKTYKGQIQLSKEQLSKFSILAEVAKITENPEPESSKVLYKMGINFSGRRPKYIFSAFSDSYTPSNELLKLMIATVPVSEKIYLPDCGENISLFNPTFNLEERTKKAQKTNKDKVAKIK